MIVAAMTLNPEKLAELAAEPGALDAASKLVILTLMLFIALTPILIYHFRFKRMLFNSTELLSTTELKDVTITTIWNQTSTSPESLYMRELNLFIKLGEPVLREPPFDLLAIIVAFGYHAFGPGLLVGIIAGQVYAANQVVGLLLFGVAGFNGVIGLSNVAIQIQAIKRRSKLQAAK